MKTQRWKSTATHHLLLSKASLTAIIKTHPDCIAACLRTAGSVDFI